MYAINPPFELQTPDDITAPVLFSSPHSGRVYPASFLAMSRLALNDLRRSEDCFVDDLIAPVLAEGLPLLKAHFPRALLDLNREAYELDPRMFDGALPPGCNTRSPRVVAGLGTVPRIVGDRSEIYAKRLPVGEAMARIETLHRPFHRLLEQTLVALKRRFGAVLLVDCHSMPSYALGRGESVRTDIILGDRFGTSCAPEIMALAEEFFIGRGYRVRRNQPYAGGYITECYGRPRERRHAFQVEINRALYLDERCYEKLACFDALAADIGALAAQLRQWQRLERQDFGWAAE